MLLLLDRAYVTFLHTCLCFKMFMKLFVCLNKRRHVNFFTGEKKKAYESYDENTNVDHGFLIHCLINRRVVNFKHAPRQTFIKHYDVIILEPPHQKTINQQST